MWVCICWRSPCAKFVAWQASVQHSTKQPSRQHDIPNENVATSSNTSPAEIQGPASEHRTLRGTLEIKLAACTAANRLLRRPANTESNATQNAPSSPQTKSHCWLRPSPADVVKVDLAPAVSIIARGKSFVPNILPLGQPACSLW